MTPEQEAILRDIQAQLRGPELSGWPQLGTDAGGRDRTVVAGLAEALTLIAELRTEIGDLEATVADLEQRVARLPGHDWPWPLSLLAGPATLLVEQWTRLESLLAERVTPTDHTGATPTSHTGATPTATDRPGGTC